MKKGTVYFMKIKPLQKDSAGRYDLYDVPEKINEIIELLKENEINKSEFEKYKKDARISGRL